jgi:hypothetical protein
MDSSEQITQERQLERLELERLTAANVAAGHSEHDRISSMFGSLTGGGASASSSDLNTSKADPLEVALNIRPIDCREAKLPAECFVNEVANKFIDIQHDYVEYIQQLQLDEQQAYSFSKSAIKTRTRHFSFLANPFFLILVI